MQKLLGNALIWTGLYFVWAASFGADGDMSMGVFMLAVLAATPLWVAGKWLVDQAEQSTQVDADDHAQSLLTAGEPDKLLSEKYFLYLRPFDSTNEFKVAENPAENLFSSEMWERDDFDDIERVLSKALSLTATFAAFGRPGEHRGAGRIFIPDQGWMDEVRRLAEGATLIFAMPSHNAGTISELRLIKEQDLLHKTIFIMPPSQPGAFEQTGGIWPERWDRMRRTCARFGLTMPEYNASGQLFMLDAASRIDSHALPDADPARWVDAIHVLLRADATSPAFDRP